MIAFSPTGSGSTLSSASATSGDSKVETISRLAQWRIESFGPCSYRRSDSFKLGIWNWFLSIEKNRYMYIQLFPEPNQAAKDQPPIVKFVLRVLSSAPGRRLYISPVHERLLRTSEVFVWPVDCTVHGCFVIDVEFLDLKMSSVNGREACSIWTNEGTLHSHAGKSTLQRLSRMLEDGIYADVTIDTLGGTLRAHNAILSASSPDFESMFLHDLEEKSSAIDMDDMTLDGCSTLLGYIYGIA